MHVVPRNDSVGYSGGRGSAARRDRRSATIRGVGNTFGHSSASPRGASPTARPTARQRRLLPAAEVRGGRSSRTWTGARPAQSALVTQRKESDTVRILGVFEGQTLGTPISLSILNEDMRPGDYREVREKYR